MIFPLASDEVYVDISSAGQERGHIEHQTLGYIQKQGMRLSSMDEECSICNG